MPHHKEGGGGIVLFQGVQYGLCAAVLISAVKGEVEDLLAGIPQVVGAVLGQVLRRGIAHWGFPSVGKDSPQSAAAGTAMGAEAVRAGAGAVK